MFKRICAIVLTVAMLLFMVCTFSVASAADSMALRVVFENEGRAGRGETVKAEIWVDNYTECSAMGVSGTYDTTVFDAAAFDVAGIVLETTAFNLGERSAVNNGEFYFVVLSADAQLENVVMSETSFKLATVTLKLKTDYFTTPGELEVNFRAADMTQFDANGDAEFLVPDDGLTANPDFKIDAAKGIVSLKPITDKMEIVLKDAPATVVRGQEFTVTVAAKNYKALASYGFDVNYDNTVLEVVDTQIVLGDNLIPEEDSITGDTDYVRVVEVSNANMGQDAAEQDLAQVTFRALKEAELNKDAGLNAKFVIKEGTDANTLAYYVDGNVDPIEMVKDYEYVATPAVANTKVVANANMMSLEITAAATTVDRGDEVVLDINLKNAVPFAGMKIYIPLDDTVFVLESSSAMANIVEKGGKKVVYLMIVNDANVSGVTDLATVTLKVKDTAAFGMTKLENAVIAMAAEFVSDLEPSKPLVLDADYENPANLIEINVVCDHAPEGFKLVNNYNGTHDIECNVPDCSYLQDDVTCTAVSSVETPATCTAAGYYTKTCACGYVWVEASGQAALGHDLKTVHAGGTSTDSKHTTTCSRGDYIMTTPCSFSEVVTGVATCQKNEQITATCTACTYSYIKEVQNSKIPHQYDNACDTTCNICQEPRTVEPHRYDNACDTACNICQEPRTVEPHRYDNACDNACNICQEPRAVEPHRYDNACDTACNICQKPRVVGSHKYDNDCDTICNTCGNSRTVDSHKYDNDCDTVCNTCGDFRTVSPHQFTNNCDTTCDICGVIREITHSFGEYVYNNDATLEADGTRTRVCTVCGHSETVTAPGTLIVLSNPFTDVKANVYYEKPVLWAVNKGITNGMGNDQFKPNETCTRGQIVTFLWRANGCPEPQSAVNPFSDVPVDAYYTKAVLWAVEQGITNGTGNGKFSPSAECVREQIVTFLWRSQGKPVTGSANPFSDVATGTYYHDAVLWAVEKEITKGTSATTFAPQDDCTRGQIVTFLYRCLA